MAASAAASRDWAFEIEKTDFTAAKTADVVDDTIVAEAAHAFKTAEVVGASASASPDSCASASASQEEGPDFNDIVERLNNGQDPKIIRGEFPNHLDLIRKALKKVKNRRSKVSRRKNKKKKKKAQNKRKERVVDQRDQVNSVDSLLAYIRTQESVSKKGLINPTYWGGDRQKARLVATWLKGLSDDGKIEFGEVTTVITILV